MFGPKINQRVVVNDLSPHRGKTGTIIGRRRSMTLPYLCKLDETGEEIWISHYSKLRTRDAA